MKEGYLLIRNFDYLGKNRPPIKLLILNEYFLNNQIDSSFIDMNLAFEGELPKTQLNKKILDIISKEIKKNIIIDINFQGYPFAKKISKIIKENFPSSKIILSGRIVLLNKKEIIEDGIYFDELLEKDILENYLGKIAMNYTNLPIIKEKLKYYPKCKNILVKEGCSFKCNFCNNSFFYNERVSKDFNKILEESKYYIENYELNENEFMRLEADNLFDSETQLNEFYNFFKDKNISFGASIRCDLLSYKTIDKLYLSGFKYLFLGLESISKEILKSSEKEYNYFEVSKILEYAMEKGIIINGNLLFGLPYETIDEAIKTVIWYSKLKINNYSKFLLDTSIYNPEKGSKLYNQLDLENLVFIGEETEKDFKDINIREINFNLIPHLYTIKSINYDTTNFYKFAKKYFEFIRIAPLSAKKINLSEEEMKNKFRIFLNNENLESIISKEIIKKNITELYEFEKKLYNNEGVLGYGEEFIKKYVENRRKK